MSRLADLTGQRYGRLTVVERSGDIGGKTAWLCICDCGNKKRITATNLKQGITKSCGCYQNEVRIVNGHSNAKHGGYGTRLYRIYRGMWQRCYDENVKHYQRYGARGITICDEWLGTDGFAMFRDWAYSHGYNETLSIDRKDNNKSYSPDNCRWATNKEQMNNRRCNVYLSLNGEQHTMAEWSDITGINVRTIKSRHRAGWKDEDVLTAPVDKRKASKTKERIKNEV